MLVKMCGRFLGRDSGAAVRLFGPRRRRHPSICHCAAVHRLSAGMFAIGYVYSFVAPLLGGAAWDLSHMPATSFLPIGVGAVTMLVAATSLHIPMALV